MDYEKKENVQDHHSMMRGMNYYHIRSKPNTTIITSPEMTPDQTLNPELLNAINVRIKQIKTITILSSTTNNTTNVIKR